ncbi:MAG: phosphate signaling complex protein PhoU [Myxococcales bacterium]|nr:phosphate signaling complex protein PhoU [Myxococcales bacterium]
MTHFSRDFEAELRELRGNLLAMGARCERAVSEAVTAFAERDQGRADDVSALDERIDRDEIEIDELALRILALRQPVADDLRFITTALKFVTDLERIGDEAKNIAERVGEVAICKQLPPHPEIATMSEMALAMLRESLDAFVARDADRAEAMLARDAEVDALYGQLLRRMFVWMREHPEAIPVAQSVASVGRYLERVGDHATNLAEHVVFMVRGDNVRHRRGAAR